MANFRRKPLATLVHCLVAGGMLLTPSILLGQQPLTPPPAVAADEVELRFVDYERRLNAILRTRRPEEQKFVADLLQKVRQGEVPVPLMESSFMWVLNNRPDTAFPFIYFERVLRLQAEKAEIAIPDFDYAIYNQRVQRRREN